MVGVKDLDTNQVAAKPAGHTTATTFAGVVSDAAVRGAPAR